MHPFVDDAVELRRRNGAVDEPPFLCLARADLVAEEQDLARPPVADEDRQPLRRSARRHRPVLRADVADERVVDDHRKVARHLQLVPAADGDAVDTRDGRLPDLAQPVVHVLEGPEPLPVLARVPEVVVGPRAQIGADTEGAAGSGHDDDADVVVP